MNLPSLSNTNIPDILITNATEINISSLQQRTIINNNDNTNDTLTTHPLPGMDDYDLSVIINPQSSNTQASSNTQLTDSHNENQDNDEDISYTEEASTDEIEEDLQIL